MAVRDPLTKFWLCIADGSVPFAGVLGAVEMPDPPAGMTLLLPAHATLETAIAAQVDWLNEVLG